MSTMGNKGDRDSANLVFLLFMKTKQRLVVSYSFAAEEELKHEYAGKASIN